jgi:sporulation integral membrane protein YtvI
MVKAWLYSIAGLAGFLAGTYVLLIYGLPLVLPFVIALVVAELIEPLVNVFNWRSKVPRTLSVTVVLLLFVGLITTAVTAAVGRLVQEILKLTDQLPYIFSAVMDLAERFSEQFGAFHANLPGSIQKIVAENLTALQSTASSHLPDLAKTLGVVSGLPGFLANLLIALIATFFISRDRQEIGAFLLSLFPGVWRPKIREVKVEVWSSAMGWAKAQLTLVLLTMVQTMIGLSLIGASYAVLMGMIVGVADLLPLLGPASIFLPWIAYSFIFGSKVFGIRLLILYAIVAGVRQVLEAKVVGDRIGLHPLAILVAVYLGFQFFGAMGFVVGPLLAILLKSMIKSGLLPIFREEPRE